MMKEYKAFQLRTPAWLLALIFCLEIHRVLCYEHGIPGTTQTLQGYDTEMGEDAICWTSMASATPEEGIAFPNNDLVHNFSIADKVELLSECPQGTWLEAFAPSEFSKPDFRPRTHQWYNYTVKGQLDVTFLDGLYVTADGGPMIAVGLIACDTLKAGFCSPFVHQQADIRQARERAEWAEAHPSEAAQKAAEEAAAAASGVPQQPKPPGYRHGGTHVHAPAIVVDVPSTPNLTHAFFLEVPFYVNESGSFFVIGTLQFFTGNTPEKPIYRIDVANALKNQDRLVVYQEPAVELKVTRPVQIAVYVCAGTGGAVLLAILLLTIKYYNHQVLRMSQVPFLVMFQLAAMAATAGCVLSNPKSDLWCNLSPPLILIPLQIFYATTLGRLWRIHAVVSPLLRNHLKRAISAREVGFFGRCWNMFTGRFQDPGGIRREVSASKVVWIILACTVPQVVLQILALLLQPQSKDIDYNEQQTIGRSVCDDGVVPLKSFQSYARGLLFLLVLVLLFMAHVARQLPSLLNESAVIYDTTLVSVLLSVLGIGVIAVTNAPTTSPDVRYMINVVLVLSVTLNSTIRIMAPKLQLARSGREILVSQLVADHKQTISRVSRENDLYNVTGMEQPRPSQDKTSSPSQTNYDSTLNQSSDADVQKFSGYENAQQNEGTETTEQKSDNSGDVNTDLENGSKALINEVKRIEGKYSSDEEKTPLNREVDVRVHWNGEADYAASNKAGHKKMLRRKIKVLKGEPPSKKLLINMVDLQNELEHVTKRVMSGLSVDREDWNLVRKLTQELEGIWARVEFEWDEDKSDEGNEDAFKKS